MSFFPGSQQWVSRFETSRAVDLRLAPWTGLRKVRSSTRNIMPRRRRFVDVRLGISGFSRSHGKSYHERRLCLSLKHTCDVRPIERPWCFFLKRSNDRCLSDRGSLKTSGRSVSFRKASWQGTRWNGVVFFSRNTVRFVVRPSSPLRKRLLDRTHPGMDRSTCHSRQGSMKENGWPTPSSFSPSSFLRRKRKDLGFHVGNREA